MELLFDDSPVSLAAALVARYAAPPPFPGNVSFSSSFPSSPQRAAAVPAAAPAPRRRPGVIASFVGPLTKKLFATRLERLPLLLLDDGGTVLQEPAAILRCCAAAAASSSSASLAPAAATAADGECSEREAQRNGSSSAAAPAAATAAATLLLGGPSAVQQGQVTQWLSLCCEQQFSLQGASVLQQLQQHMATRTFFVADHLTLADLALYAACHGWMATASEKERLLHCNVTRWFDHVQHLPGVAGAVEQLPIVDVLPAPLPQPSPPAAARRAASSSSSTEALLPNGIGGSSSGQQQPRKRNQQQPKDLLVNGVATGEEFKQKMDDRHRGTAARAAGGEATSSKGRNDAGNRPVDDVSRLRAVVGQIRKIWRHPDADQLFCEEVDIGEEQPRLIASGLVRYAAAEELEGKKVLVLANMKPRQLRGFPSHGMLLCASSLDHTKCEILRPPPETPLGEAVTWEGAERGGPPDTPHMNTKEGKYPFAAVQPHFRTDENCVAYYKGHRFMTSRGPVTCATIAGGTIS